MHQFSRESCHASPLSVRPSAHRCCGPSALHFKTSSRFNLCPVELFDEVHIASTAYPQNIFAGIPHHRPTTQSNRSPSNVSYQCLTFHVHDNLPQDNQRLPPDSIASAKPNQCVLYLYSCTPPLSFQQGNPRTIETG